jgi:hypothetical protein
MSTDATRAVREEKARREITAYQIVIGIATVGTFAMLLALVISVVVLTRPAVRFVEETLEIKSDVVCPGGTLHATVFMTSNRTPVTVFLAQNWYSVERNEAIVADGVVGVTFPEGREGATYVIHATVPDTLTPGQYEFWTGPGNTRAAIRVPIRVQNGGCSGS